MSLPWLVYEIARILEFNLRVIEKCEMGTS